MNEENQMSIEVDKKIETSTSYLLFLKCFKKISKIVLIMGILLFLNIGNKYPIMSESSSSTDVIAELYNVKLEYNVAKAEADKYIKLYQNIYERSLIQQIEFESEIVIPDYIDFKYVEYAYKVSKELEISPRIAFRLIFRESSFDDKVVSKAGAKGLTQLMPSTRRTYYNSLRVDTLNLDKNQQDIYIGLYYLKDLYEFWKDRGNPETVLWKLSVASYNSGTGPVIKYKGIPPYKETSEFVVFITRPHSNPAFYATILRKNTKKETS